MIIIYFHWVCGASVVGYFDDRSVLITGGGSLGRELIFQLLKSDVKEVRVLDNSEQQLYRCELQFHRDPRVSYLLGDVGDYDDVDMAVAYKEMTCEQAAREKGISKECYKKRFQRKTAALKDHIKKEGYI